MLHCPPSRLHLTSSDLADFEQRFAAKQTGHYVPLKPAGMRLGFGVEHSTLASIVPAHRNLGRKRADSCTSQARLCSDEDIEVGIPEIVTSAASPIDSAPRQKTISSPRHLQVSEKQSADSSPLRHPLPSGPQSENSSTSRPGQSPSLPHIPERVTSLSYERRAAIQQTRLQKNIRPSSIPRPRRLGQRPAPFQILEVPPYVNERIERQHNLRPGPQTWDGQALSPEFRPSVVFRSHINPLLDPGASVFVPRTRFGSINSSSAEAGSGDAVHGSHDDAVESHGPLRELPALSRRFQHSDQDPRRSTTSQTGTSLYTSRGIVGQARRESRTHDQNTDALQFMRNDGQATTTRQSSASFVARRGSGSQRPVVFPRRDSSRRYLNTTHKSRQASGPNSSISTGSNVSNSLLDVPRDIDSGRQMPRPVSPALSTGSRSTPNLLHSKHFSTSTTHARCGSFTQESCDREAEEATDATSALRDLNLNQTNGVVPELPYTEPGSALEHLLNDRTSPLDELSQKLSRMASNRPRSVGHSFERPPGNRQRTSLLSGDPFRQESPPQRPLSSDGYEDYQSYRPQQSDREKRDSIMTTLSADEDPVALSLALPSPALPSSPIVRSPPAHTPGTPATALRERALSPRSSTSVSSPVRGSEWISSGTPPMPPSITPRMTVYNDSRPAELQPQTPADLARSTARRRGRAGTASSHRSQTSNGYTGSPSVIAERSSNRHTYPAATPPHPESHTVTTPARVPVVVERHSARQSMTSHLEENDIEAALDGLEQDRQTWMHRHEHGSLDTTPPAEGHFERYLS